MSRTSNQGWGLAAGAAGVQHGALTQLSSRSWFNNSLDPTSSTSTPHHPSCNLSCPTVTQSQSCISVDPGQGMGVNLWAFSWSQTRDGATAATAPTGLRVSLSVVWSLCPGASQAGMVHLVPSAVPASWPAEAGHPPFPETAVRSQGTKVLLRQRGSSLEERSVGSFLMAARQALPTPSRL